MALFFPELFLLLSCLVIFLLTLGKMSSSYGTKYYCCLVSNCVSDLCR